ncbi:hypothetical protein Ancab_019830 [Ancistrocladus abbreviatus]
MAGKKRSTTSDTDMFALHKEWEEVLCPICMDHPHNAVLLLCSSHGKGCRSYICDTSYRHSNCLDRFRKLKMDSRSSPLPGRPVPTSHDNLSSGVSLDNELAEIVNFGVDEFQQEVQEGVNTEPVRDTTVQEVDAESSPVSNSILKCPLCRGDVLGWQVVEEVRSYLNQKRRSCSRETCSFVGNYRELRRHARSVHPTARPGEVDPSRQQAWRRLEHQREYDDIVSAVRSAMPGAIVLGDYVVENGDRFTAENERASGDIDGPWWPTFFLFQMFGSMEHEPRTQSRAWTRHRRPGGTSSGRRYGWGENLLGVQDEDDDSTDYSNAHISILSDVDEDDPSPTPRRRRRLTWSRSNGDRA